MNAGGAGRQPKLPPQDAVGTLKPLPITKQEKENDKTEMVTKRGKLI